MKKINLSLFRGDPVQIKAFINWQKHEISVPPGPEQKTQDQDQRGDRKQNAKQRQKRWRRNYSRNYRSRNQADSEDEQSENVRKYGLDWTQQKLAVVLNENQRLRAKLKNSNKRNARLYDATHRYTTFIIDQRLEQNQTVKCILEDNEQAILIYNTIKRRRELITRANVAEFVEDSDDDDDESEFEEEDSEDSNPNPGIEQKEDGQDCVLVRETINIADKESEDDEDSDDEDESESDDEEDEDEEDSDLEEDEDDHQYNEHEEEDHKAEDLQQRINLPNAEQQQMIEERHAFFNGIRVDESLDNEPFDDLAHQSDIDVDDDFWNDMTPQKERELARSENGEKF